MDYTQLIGAKTVAGSIANWMNSSQLSGAAPTIIAEAESFIYRRLRHWRMTTEIPLTMAVGNDYIDISSIANYLEDRVLRFDGLVGGSVYSSRIVRKTPEEVKAAYGYDSTGARVRQTPQIFYNNGTRLKFDSPADLAYPVELTYYAQPAALSESNTTNWLTIYYPRLLRCALMAGAAEFMKDSGVGNYDRGYWEQNCLVEIDVAAAESDRSVRSQETGAIMT